MTVRRCLSASARAIALVTLVATLAATLTMRQAIAIDEQFYGGNDILFYDPSACTPSGSNSASTALVDGDNIKKAFFYFTGKGLTAAQAAGIVGNLIQESGVNPKSVQKDGPGHGIAQWSANDRWAALKKWAGSRDPLDLAVQLDFMWHEMTAVAPWNQSLKGSKLPQYPSLQDITSDTKDAAIKASASFGYLYERFGKAGDRNSLAGNVWAKYHGSAASTGATPDTGCAAASTGTCDNAPQGWVQATNRVVTIACEEWNKKVVEDAGANCDQAGEITKYAKAVGFPRCGPAWCGMFVGYVYKTAGIPFPTRAGVASVNNLWGYLGSINARESTGTQPKPGDVIIYGSDHHHTGLVVGTTGKYFTSIEGNTGADGQDKANKSGKEGVHMHHRPYPSPDVDSWGSYDVLSNKQS